MSSTSKTKETDTPPASAAMPLFIKQWSQTDFVYQGFILAFIYILAFCVRLFSVLRYESIIHEFDPWFNFRSTRYLVAEGFYEFWNWFDNMTWYPLGRWVGNTVYPGLMWTAALFYKILHSWNLPIDIRNVCVFLAPFMAGNTAIVTYLFTKEAHNSASAIVAAGFVALTPGYISRSVAGSYDNEAVAIFAMMFTFYTWLKAVRTGSIIWSGVCAVAYFYMVSTWGGYIFLINLIPFHVFALIAIGRFSYRLYVAYSVFYPVATLMSMQIGFVGFQPVSSPEHAGAFFVFCILQLAVFLKGIRNWLSDRQYHYLIGALVVAAIGLVIATVLLAMSGYVPALTGRFKSLLGSTSNIAIVKSVSEHQPTSWSTFFLDLHILSLFSVPGLYFCFTNISDTNLFVILYLVFSAYFASIMVRLMLVISPVVCVIGGIGLSETLLTFSHVSLIPESKSSTDKKKSKEASPSFDDDQDGFRDNDRKSMYHLNGTVALGILFLLFSFLYLFVLHCSWISSIAHSSPNIILIADQQDGSRKIFDDYREAYQWIRRNTPEDAKIMSWWDYGYQITGMGNRTTIVDNNTRNNSHIATVGMAMASREHKSIEVIRRLDVDYVLVVFGGLIGYSSDDINKFLWMVRIGGGVYPEVKEPDYMAPRGGYYTVGRDGSETMLNSLMYSLCYYRFAEVPFVYGQPAGFDRTRGQEIGKKDVQLKYLEEAFTTEHWMVRIYQVKKLRDF